MRQHRLLLLQEEQKLVDLLNAVYQYNPDERKNTAYHITTKWPNIP